METARILTPNGLLVGDAPSAGLSGLRVYKIRRGKPKEKGIIFN